MTLLPKLTSYINTLDPDLIDEERKSKLNTLVVNLNKAMQQTEPLKLTFICTHNSRRSQITQLWSMVFASMYDLPILSFSGGTEVTAFNPKAIAAMERAGFQLLLQDEKETTTNPIIMAQAFVDQDPWIIFSKVFDDSINPQKNFIAMMTCDHADQNCPFIPGADARFPLRYVDPKVADNTAQESETYDHTVFEIGNELHYIFSKMASS